MTFDQLESFLQIARSRSFSRAAILLDLAQPTVSGRIAALERETGTDLFARKGHHVELTEAGRVLLPYAERVLALRAEGLQAIQRLAFGGLGRLTLGANPSCSQYLVPRLLEVFYSEHPSAPVVVRTALTPSLMEGLLDGVLQLAICSRPQTAPQAQELWTYADPLVLVAAPHHPLGRAGTCRRADLAHHTILSTQAGPTRLGLRHLLPPDHSTPIAIEATAGEMLKQLLLRGIGMTVLPTLAVWEELEQGTLVRVHVQDAELPHYEVALVTWEGRTLAPAAEAFAALVRAANIPALLANRPPVRRQ